MQTVAVQMQTDRSVETLTATEIMEVATVKVSEQMMRPQVRYAGQSRGSKKR